MRHIATPLRRMLKSFETPVKTVEEALEIIGGNFRTEKTNVWQKVGTETVTLLDGTEREIPLIEDLSDWSLIRHEETHHPFHIPSKGYGVVQYLQSMHFLNEKIEEHGLSIVHGHVLEGGAQLVLLLKGPEVGVIGQDQTDKVECYYYVSNSHDGSSKLTFMCTPWHAKSQTIFTPLGDAVFSHKHTKNVLANMSQAGRKFSMLQSHFDKYMESFLMFAELKLSDEDARVYFELVIDGDSTQAVNARDKMFDLFKQNGTTRIGSCEGTLLGGFIAAQTFADYYKTVRTKGGNEVDKMIRARLTGNAAKLKAESYGCALELMQKLGGDEQD